MKKEETIILNYIFKVHERQCLTMEITSNESKFSISSILRIEIDLSGRGVTFSE